MTKKKKRKRKPIYRRCSPATLKRRQSPSLKLYHKETQRRCFTMYDGNPVVGSVEYDSGVEKPAPAEAEKAADPGYGLKAEPDDDLAKSSFRGAAKAEAP